MDEVQVSLKKPFLQHWVLQNLEREFIVSSKNVWDPHPVNLIRSSSITKNYIALAESERGPQVIVYPKCIRLSSI